MNFQIAEEENTPRIKVIGVGGGGSNAVQNMIRSKVEGVSFIVANTDAQHIATIDTDCRLQLGEKLTRGLGAGSNPTIGRDAALESVDAIKEALKGADMVFVAAGMGGGTGSGAAPVIAQIAKETGALTVGVVTKPFFFEGPRRHAVAEEAVNELKKQVDSLIVVPNDRLVALAQKNSPYVDMLKQADDVLRFAVQGVVDVINKPGYISVDFADVRTVMSKPGMSVMGMGVAGGEKRAHDASMRAISSPFLEIVSIEGAQSVLVNITSNKSVTMQEISEAYDIVIKAVGREDAMVLVGNVFDDDIGDEIHVTVIATGIQEKAKSFEQPSSQSTQFRQEQRYDATNQPQTMQSPSVAAYPHSAAPSEQHSREYHQYSQANYSSPSEDEIRELPVPRNLNYFKKNREDDYETPSFIKKQND